MRIKAYIFRSTEVTKHYKSSIENGKIEANEEVSSPKWIEISEEEDGVYLYHFSSGNNCIADTWHESIEDAKKQAMFEFGVAEEQWSPID